MAPTLGQALLKAGVINARQLEEAIQGQVIYGGRLGTTLMELGFIDIATLSRFLSQQFNMPTVDHTRLKPCPPEVLKLFGKKLAQKHEAVPLALDGNRLDVLLSNPRNMAAIDEIGFATGKRVKPYVAPELVVVTLMEKYFGIPRDYRYIQISQTLQMKKAQTATKKTATTPTPAPKREEIKGLNIGANEELISEKDFQEMILAYHSHTQRETEAPPAMAAIPPPPPPPPTSLSSEAQTVPDFAILQAAPAAPPPQMVKAPPKPPPPPPPIEEAQTIVEPEEPIMNLEEMVSEPASWPVAEPAKEESEELEIIEELPEALSLSEAVQRLKEVQERDELGQVVLAFALSYFKRAALFIIRSDMALGWDGMGGSVNRKNVQSIMLPLNAPSIFKTVHDSQSFYLGAVPKTPVNDRFLKLMGNEQPRSVFLIPILFRGQMVNILYGDNGQGENAPFDISDLLILAPKIPPAFEEIILRKKKQTQSGG